jgi:hypothetical protein
LNANLLRHYFSYFHRFHQILQMIYLERSLVNSFSMELNSFSMEMNNF